MQPTEKRQRGLRKHMQLIDLNDIAYLLVRGRLFYRPLTLNPPIYRAFTPLGRHVTFLRGIQWECYYLCHSNTDILIFNGNPRIAGCRKIPDIIWFELQRSAMYMHTTTFIDVAGLTLLRLGGETHD